MENAVEALKIAFAMLMFGMALTLSISSFSQATQAVDAITTLRDREAHYTYVTPTDELTRNVGIETVITSMYRAYKENIKIYFYDSYGNPIDIYIIFDGKGGSLPTSCFELANHNFESPEEATIFLHLLVGGINIDKKNVISDEIMSDEEFNGIIDKYKNNFIYTDGIYNQFVGKEFKEQLGEYYEGTGASEIKKRVITYTLQ